MKKILGLFIMKMLGWKIDRNLPKELFDQCVLIAAPHTSNWDYLLAVSSLGVVGVDLRYTIKKQWMEPPLGWLFRLLGGIGVDTTPKTNGEKPQGLVDVIADLFQEDEKLSVMVPAEGTRSRQPQWKTGFYYIALTAKVPIALGYLDYERKIAGVGKAIYPSGNVEDDMLEVMRFYKNIPAKFPEDFALDERFYPPKHVG